MKTTKSGIFRFLIRPFLRLVGCLALAAILAAALIAAASPAIAATVSVSATENNGPVSVTASATFYNGESGTVRIYLDAWPSSVSSASGQGSASCSYTADGAVLSNGQHILRATATDSQGTVEDIYTFTIQNPVSLTANAPTGPTGPIDVTGTSQFLSRVNPLNPTGKVEIRRKPSTSSDYTESILRKKTYYEPSVSFSCQDMDEASFAAGLLDVAAWANGDWDIKVEATGANSEKFSPVVVTTTVQNPISITLNVPTNPKGPIDATGVCRFMARSNPEYATGRIEIRRKPSTSSEFTESILRKKTYYDPTVSFSCQDMGEASFPAGLLDIAAWTNGDWDIKAEAIAINQGRMDQVKTITVDNTPQITASCPRYVSGNFDITGSAVFTEPLSGNQGTLYINIYTQSTSTGAGAKVKTYVKGDPVDFSYAEMAGAPLNADTLGHGEHVAYIIAQAKNGVWSPWLAVPFRTGPPEADGSGNLKIVTP